MFSSFFKFKICSKNQQSGSGELSSISAQPVLSNVTHILVSYNSRAYYTYISPLCTVRNLVIAGDNEALIKIIAVSTISLNVARTKYVSATSMQTRKPGCNIGGITDQHEANSPANSKSTDQLETPPETPTSKPNNFHVKSEANSIVSRQVGD